MANHPNRKLKLPATAQPKRTLVPGRAYRWADKDVGAHMSGPWMVALSRTHFLTGLDGLCATFLTEAAALAAYAARRRRKEG